MVSPAFQVR